MITDSDVKMVAKLSRLEFDEAEMQSIKEDMNSVLGYMEILNKIDTSSVSDLVRPQGSMREDEVLPSAPAEELLANAPKKKGTAFVVPKVID